MYEPASADTGSGSKDGSGAADHDQPYVFGRRPRALAPWPFTERQYARLLVVRGRFQDHVIGERATPIEVDDVTASAA